MLRDELDAIAGGYHGDPFRVLGPHADPKGAAWQVRAFLPQAVKVNLVHNGATAPMRREHEAGIWLIDLKTEPGHYQYSATLHDGGETVIEDPYRFGNMLSEHDLHLFGEGTLFHAWRSLGAHAMTVDGIDGVLFSVWAPSAVNMTVAGDFNGWDTLRHCMRRRDIGIWELFIPGAAEGAHYKYRMKSRLHGYEEMKSDPFGFSMEAPPNSASIVWDLGNYQWNDAAWIEQRGQRQWLEEPMSVYEVHLESWMRKPDGSPLSYREMAVSLVEYVKRLHYTHIELLPMMEHPFSGSWGYQVIGYFAPTARFGNPDDFRFFVDRCHQEGIGVIVDWVPGHFPKDAHGLAYFDGTALYEHADPRQGEQPDWGTNIFNYSRNEVRSFLISNALFWLEEYHIDGLRVDAVASMLYLDFSREGGDWIPNRYGGRENIEAIEFLKQCNIEVHKIPGAVTIAEESTSFPGVSRPVYAGGLGFTMKWNMGWMHDMFKYFKHDPLYRKFQQNNLTFSLLYAFTENFLLPISHDEVVHGKGSLMRKMPGDEWQRFANLRAFLGYMYAHPGKKLLFMGQEIGQYEEWDNYGSIRWDLLDYDLHRKLQQYVGELNRLYRQERALFEVDYSFEGFDWVDFRDWESSTLSFVRKAKNHQDWLLTVCNFTPQPRHGYRVGVHEPGGYLEILNSDSHLFGGSNMGNRGWVMADAVPMHSRPYSIAITLPPLSVSIFKPAH